MNYEATYENRVRELENELQAAKVTIGGYKTACEDFLSLAAHDLHAPARKIATFVERLSSKLQEPVQPETSAYLERIQSSVNLMRSMIDQLTVLSEIAVAEPSWQACDLNELVKSVLKDLGTSVPADALVQYSSLPVVEGDRRMLKKLLENLLQNSLKFSGRKTGILISITAVPAGPAERETLSLDSGKQYVKIEINDNGIGFNNEYAGKIFRPFLRLHGKSAYEGNGLGLAICEKVVEKHAGVIFANSGDDGGACFTIIIPENYS